MSESNPEYSPRHSTPTPSSDEPDVFVPGVDEAPVSAVFAPDPDSTTRIPYHVVRQAILDTRLTVDVTPVPITRPQLEAPDDPDATSRIPYSVVRQAIVYSRPTDVVPIPAVPPGEIPLPPDETGDMPRVEETPVEAEAEAVEPTPEPVVAPEAPAEPVVVVPEAEPAPEPAETAATPETAVEPAAEPEVTVAPTEPVVKADPAAFPWVAKALAAGAVTPPDTKTTPPEPAEAADTKTTPVETPKTPTTDAKRTATDADTSEPVTTAAPQRAEIPAETAPATADDLSQLPPPQTADVPAPVPAPQGGKTTFLGTLYSEVLKLFTLQSTWWVFGVTLVVSVGLGVVVMFTMNIIPQQGMGAMPIKATMAASLGTVFSQVILGVLAVLVATNEYASGQIRATLLGAPTRTMVLVSKAVVIGVVTFVVSVITYWLTTLISWPFFSSRDQPGNALPGSVTITDDRFTGQGVATIMGLAIATTLVVLLALAVGMLTRNTAAGIAVVVILLLVLPSLWGPLSGLIGPWAVTVNSYLLKDCQQGLYGDGPFGFLKSLLVTGLWAAIPLVAAGILLKKRDA